MRTYWNDLNVAHGLQCQQPGWFMVAGISPQCSCMSKQTASSFTLRSNNICSKQLILTSSSSRRRMSVRCWKQTNKHNISSVRHDISSTRWHTATHVSIRCMFHIKAVPRPPLQGLLESQITTNETHKSFDCSQWLEQSSQLLTTPVVTQKSEAGCGEILPSFQQMTVAHIHTYISHLRDKESDCIMRYAYLLASLLAHSDWQTTSINNKCNSTFHIRSIKMISITTAYICDSNHFQ